MTLLRRFLAAAGLSFLGGAVLSVPSEARADSAHHRVREVEIVVRRGYQPNRIEVVHGEHVQLKFVRQESSDCSSEVVFKALGIRQALPEGKPVVIRLPDLAPGEYEFHCGMNMISGKLVVRAKS
jgi:plastocyanin domain-containing protein